MTVGGIVDVVRQIGTGKYSCRHGPNVIEFFFVIGSPAAAVG